MLRKIYTYIFCFIILTIACEAKPVVISIGANCQPAIKLRKFNLRQAAYPFDWVFSNSLDSVIKCIDDNFEHWLDPDFLEYKGWYINNFYYGIGFSHDFPNVSDDPNFTGKVTPDNFFKKNFKDYLPEISKKYNRRIQRFFKLLKSNEYVIFLYSNNEIPASAKRFVYFIKNRYPNLRFSLVSVSQGDIFNRGAYKHEGNIWYFYGYEKEEKLPWWIDDEWYGIFYLLNLLK